VYHIKLTNQDGTTTSGTQWGPGVRHEAAPGEVALCAPTAIHFYSGNTPQEALALAAHMNIVHGGFKSPRAWTFEPEWAVVSDGATSGCKAGTTLEEVGLPEVTVAQKVEATIRCALRVCRHERWRVWAEGWLSGDDRTQASAEFAKRAAEEVWSLERAAAAMAAWAARDAAALEVAEQKAAAEKAVVMAVAMTAMAELVERAAAALSAMVVRMDGATTAREVLVKKADEVDVETLVAEAAEASRNEVATLLGSVTRVAAWGAMFTRHAAPPLSQVIGEVYYRETEGE